MADITSVDVVSLTTCSRDALPVVLVSTNTWPVVVAASRATPPDSTTLAPIRGANSRAGGSSSRRGTGSRCWLRDISRWQALGIVIVVVLATPIRPATSCTSPADPSALSGCSWRLQCMEDIDSSSRSGIGSLTQLHSKLIQSILFHHIVRKERNSLALL